MGGQDGCYWKTMEVLLMGVFVLCRGLISYRCYLLLSYIWCYLVDHQYLLFSNDAMTFPNQWRISFYLATFTYSCHIKRDCTKFFYRYYGRSTTESQIFFLLNYCRALDLDSKAAYVFLCSKRIFWNSVHSQRSFPKIIVWFTTLTAFCRTNFLNLGILTGSVNRSYLSVCIFFPQKHFFYYQQVW